LARGATKGHLWSLRSLAMGQPICRTQTPAPKLDSTLRIGWKVKDRLVPLVADGGIRDPTDEDLVTVDAKDINAHTAIIAQSGGGKSFFVGRLLEEISLGSRARCLVFDPNGDYHAINVVETEKIWNWDYNNNKQRGFLTHDNETDFRRVWSKVRILINSADRNRYQAQNLGPKQHDSDVGYFDWPDLSSEQLAALLAPRTEVLLRRQVYRAHEFVRRAYRALQDLPAEDKIGVNLLEFSETVMTGGALNLSYLPECVRHVAFKLAAEIGTRAREDEGQRLYFTAAADFREEPIIKTKLAELGRDVAYGTEADLAVVDLLSVSKAPVRDLAVSSLLDYEWNRALKDWQDAVDPKTDARRPRFIVLDEAHNFIPNEPWEPGQQVIKDQVRRIAAEGRKYGMFLIIISQRPDKLDPYVLAECKNHVIMNLAPSVVDDTIRLLGLGESLRPHVEKCVGLEKGRGMISGKWLGERTEKHEYFYGAARRTKEGARDLREEYWPKPWDHL
jgi:hypothetical protein